jgi:hypothetical protein
MDSYELGANGPVVSRVGLAPIDKPRSYEEGDRRGSNPRPSEPQVGGPAFRDGQRAALVRTRRP